MREALAAMHIGVMSTASEVVITGVLMGVLPGDLRGSTSKQSFSPRQQPPFLWLAVWTASEASLPIVSGRDNSKASDAAGEL